MLFIIEYYERVYQRRTIKGAIEPNHKIAKTNTPMTMGTG